MLPDWNATFANCLQQCAVRNIDNFKKFGKNRPMTNHWFGVLIDSEDFDLEESGIDDVDDATDTTL